MSCCGKFPHLIRQRGLTMAAVRIPSRLDALSRRFARSMRESTSLGSATNKTIAVEGVTRNQVTV